MPKLPLSVTLDRENLLWLRAQTAAGRRRSLSETLDQIVSDARRGGRVAEHAVRSVLGTIDITDSDPDLLEADVYVRAQFSRSTRELVASKESPAGMPAGPKLRKPRAK